MRHVIPLAFVATFPVLALATDWKDVPLVDRTCSGVSLAMPDDHPVACLLQCAGSGLGIVDHGTWIPLDEAGNRKALEALRASHHTNHVRVNVVGERNGDVIQASSVSMAE